MVDAFDPGDSRNAAELLAAIAQAINQTNGTDWELRSRAFDSSGSAIDRATADAQGNWDGIEHGQQSVTTAGTNEALNGGTSVAIPDGSALVVRADGDNTGNIYVGDADVSSSNGFPLGAGESVGLIIDDLATVHIDADNDGEGVGWIAEVNA